jgi:hypothetical protein
VMLCSHLGYVWSRRRQFRGWQDSELRAPFEKLRADVSKLIGFSGRLRHRVRHIHNEFHSPADFPTSLGRRDPVSSRTSRIRVPLERARRGTHDDWRWLMCGSRSTELFVKA